MSYPSADPGPSMMCALYDRTWNYQLGDWIYHFNDNDCIGSHWSGALGALFWIVVITVPVVVLVIKMVTSAVAENDHTRLKSPEDYSRATALLRARTELLHEQMRLEFQASDLKDAHRYIEGQAKKEGAKIK